MKQVNNILLAMCLCLINCNGDENAPEELAVDFLVTLNKEEAPVTVTVYNLSTGATTYEWEFVGGTPSSSSEENPEEITYANSGEFIISLTASNQIDDITVAYPIQIFDSLLADFEISLNSTVIPTELTIINNSVGADSFTWSFEGGLPNQSSDEIPATVIYNETGEFEIVLEVSAEGRTKSSTKSITLTDHVIIESDWFSVDYIDPGTYIFKENSSSQVNISYLLIGESRALMFDTGSGENSPIGGYKIKNYINQITDLPVSLVLSHFHFDHNQNINEFDNIAFPSLDFLQQKVGTDNIYTFSQEELFLGNTPVQVEVDEWLPVNEEIDLGNRIIELINIPGHTDESVAIIDKTNKLVFLGDYLYNGGLFVFDLNKYEESVDYLIDNIPSDYRLFGAHGPPEVAHSQLAKLKSAIVKIKSGECSFQSTMVFGKPVQVYNCEGLSIVLFI